MRDWERRLSALRQALGSKGYVGTDELRRGIEAIDIAKYEAIGYYERWLESLEFLLIEKGVVSREEVDARMADFNRGEA